ncbi:MAG: hypothetical protein H7X88_01060 [Gloeobacteraceae cyanobacterium ES-bin-316]|nr:hypothetical protein [Ferruginibacter sp.]
MKEMENNFYRDEFEQMLLDTTEDFRMYPSRKVWHSIYNDLHPDRKWPSFAVCLLLLTAILYVGVSNNNNISKTSKNLFASSISTDAVLPSQLPKSSGKENIQQNNSIALQQDIKASTASNTNTPSLATDEPENMLPFPNTMVSERLGFTDSASHGIVISLREKEFFKDSHNPFLTVQNASNHSGSTEDTPDLFGGGKDLTVAQNSVKNETGSISASENLKQKSELAQSENNQSDKVFKQMSDVATTETSKDAGIKSELKTEKNLTREENAWIEDFAFHNKRNANRWKTNLSFQYYVTPSVGYRHLNKHNNIEPVNGLLLTTTASDEVNQQAAPNFEAGAVLILDASKRLKLKSGLQFNYTNYITYAHSLQHPTQTTVLLVNQQNGYLRHTSYNTTYGNVHGSNFSKLNNKTLQISLPIAVDYRVAGNDKIRWYMGAGVQPSYVLSGNAYLISADNKNFVKDGSMLRRWNANANLETFVSIKTPSGVYINVGPQLRYQLLSTYNKNYSYTEKLYNVGLKIAVTKKL